MPPGAAGMTRAGAAAGGTGLEATIPSWAFEGGFPKLLERLKDPATRARLKREMVTGSPGWWNIIEAAGGWDGIVLANAQNEDHKHFEGKNMAQIARDPTAVDEAGGYGMLMGPMSTKAERGKFAESLKLDYPILSDPAVDRLKPCPLHARERDLAHVAALRLLHQLQHHEDVGVGEVGGRALAVQEAGPAPVLFLPSCPF